MILADTSIWVDHLRGGHPEIDRLLHQSRLMTHPFVVAEVALGSISQRQTKLMLMDMLPQAVVATPGEVRRLIESHRLFGTGVGFVDVHLLASCLLTPGTVLWTRDTRLNAAAKFAGIPTFG